MYAYGREKFLNNLQQYKIKLYVGKGYFCRNFNGRVHISQIYKVYKLCYVYVYMYCIYISFIFQNKTV